jgi:hypothetical protein
MRTGAAVELGGNADVAGGYGNPWSSWLGGPDWTSAGHVGPFDLRPDVCPADDIRDTGRAGDDRKGEGGH